MINLFTLGRCSAGGWCDGKTFHQCLSGTYNLFTGSTALADCVKCPPGYYCTGPGVIAFNSSVCGTGHYCPAATKYAKQFPCPAGTYNPNINRTSIIDACVTCPAGYFCPQGTSGLTNSCPRGYYCPEGTGAGTRYACPLGTYSGALGLVNSTQCVDCPVGHYCPDGSSGQPSMAPMPCRPGSYNPHTKTGYVLNCRPCSAGFSCPSAGQNASTDPCMEGYYCPNGTITNTQFPCPPGRFTNSTSLTRPEECTPCPPGFSCNWATGFPTSPWQPCRQGHFCPQGTISCLFFRCYLNAYYR